MHGYCRKHIAWPHAPTLPLGSLSANQSRSTKTGSQNIRSIVRQRITMPSQDDNSPILPSSLGSACGWWPSLPSGSKTYVLWYEPVPPVYPRPLKQLRIMRSDSPGGSGLPWSPGIDERSSQYPGHFTGRTTSRAPSSDPNKLWGRVMSKAPDHRLLAKLNGWVLRPLE